MHSGTRTAVDRLASCRRHIFRQIGMRKIEAPIVDNHGGRPIVVVGEHELVSDVLVQASRTDHFANLFVVMDDGRFIGSAILPERDALSSANTDTLEEPVHRDSEIGLLLRAAQSCENGLNFAIRLQSQAGEIQGAREVALPV